MTALNIDLDWFRCPQGYRLVRAAEIARAFGEDPRTYPDEDWIVPNSEMREWYRPLDENDSICLAFAALKTPQSLLEFTKLYGPLTSSSPQWGDSVEGWLRVAHRFFEILSWREKGPRKIASVFRSQIIASLNRAGLAAPAPDELATLNQLIGTVDLVADDKRGIHFRIGADVLVTGLWWQLAQKVSGGTGIRICRFCSAPFETGPGPGRHIDSTFCCERHKVRHFSLARRKRRRIVASH